MSLAIRFKNFLDETGSITRFTGRFFSVGIKPWWLREF